MGNRERLDQYLVRMGFARSRRRARELVERGLVSVNGRTHPKGTAIAPGDLVELGSATEAASIKPNAGIALEVLFEDASVLVINKPAPMPCHPLDSAESATVMNAMVARYPEVASAGDKPLEGGLVHRLDNGTSGALLIARDRTAFRALRDAIRDGRIMREYEALVAGELRIPLELRDPIAHHPRNPRKMVVATSPADTRRGRARPAYTRVEAIEHLGAARTLLLVTPRTGCRHQIRVHLAHQGYPIVGDELYGGSLDQRLAAGRFLLHLRRVGFESPVSGSIAVEAPRPADLLAALGC